MQAAKALVSLCIRAGSHEFSLPHNALSNKFYDLVHMLNFEAAIPSRLSFYLFLYLLAKLLESFLRNTSGFLIYQEVITLR